MSDLILSSLIDRKVLGFVDWKSELDKEDISEFGRIVKRYDIHNCYKIYREFQERPEVVERRKYLYGV